jgi:hypothetical protein
MPPLICSFASPRSPRERIRRYIDYLERLAESGAPDESFVETVDGLISRARSWLSDGELAPARSDAPPH